MKRLTVKSAATIVFCAGLLASASAQIADLKITMQNNASVPATTDGGRCNGGGGGWGMQGTYSHKYGAVSRIELSGASNSQHNFVRNTTADSIRHRGNSTSGAAKKPYRIKFGDKMSVFGMDSAKSWVLLANFYDGTFALNAMAFELGKRLGVPAPKYEFVNLYINNQYMGIYQLTQQIQSNKGMVNVREKHGGWLAEFDYHDPASDECFTWFTTGSNRYNLTTFVKAPELDDKAEEERGPGAKPTAADSTKYLREARTDIITLVNKMAEGGFPNNGYRDLIDLESFAKYVLIQLVMDNFDFNSKTQGGFLPGSNFVHRIDDCVKIKAGPLWDFDLAAGVQNAQGGGIWGGPMGDSFPAHYQSYQDPIIPRHAFYDRLWQDPVFKAKYKKAWDTHKSDFEAMGNFIDQIKTKVSGSVTGKGTNTWANNSMMMSGTLTDQQFNTEVNGLKTWWTNRLNWVNGQLNSLNASADVAESDPAIGPHCSGEGPIIIPPDNTTLTCTGLQSDVPKGGVITTPALTCSNGSAASDANYFGVPTSTGGWNADINGWRVNESTITTSYNIEVEARCGGSVQPPRAACGTVAVVPALSVEYYQKLSVSRISVVKNGVNLQVQKNASVKIYNLKGKLQKSMSFQRGVHNISLGSLPKGMYMLNVAIDGKTQVLRLPVR